MAWAQWCDLRRFADWRLGIRSADDLNGDEEVTELG